MIADIWLRWCVTGLFLLSAAQCVYALVTAREDRTWIDQTSRALHLLMAVAMLVMAWPAGMGVPNRPPLVFFLLNRSRYGKQLFLMGNNPTAASLSGVRNNRIRILMYVFSGMFSAFAAVPQSFMCGSSIIIARHASTRPSSP